MSSPITEESGIDESHIPTETPPLPVSPRARESSGEEPSMKDLVHCMRHMMTRLMSQMDSMQSKIDEMQTSLKSLQAKLAAPKADMITKETFQELEARVIALEKGGVSSVQTGWMHQQMSCLDPANQCLYFKGLLQDSRERTKQF